MWQQVLQQLSHMSDVFYTAATGKYDVRDICGKLSTTILKFLTKYILTLLYVCYFQTSVWVFFYLSSLVNMLQLQWPIVFLTGLYSHIIMIMIIIVIIIIIIIIIFVSTVLEPVALKLWVFFVFPSSYRSSYVLSSLGMVLESWSRWSICVHLFWVI
jgi:hypothetical protein